MDNIFRIFDPHLSGSIRFTDLLIAFSMSMKGSGEEILLEIYWEKSLHYIFSSLVVDMSAVITIFHVLLCIVLAIYIPISNRLFL